MGGGRLQWYPLSRRGRDIKQRGRLWNPEAGNGCSEHIYQLDSLNTSRERIITTVTHYRGMPPDRLRSIVPMFGGGTQYVETLNAILAVVDEHQPTTDELIGWHRGTFQNVSSRESIMRRVRYLENVGFLHRSCGVDCW